MAIWVVVESLPARLGLTTTGKFTILKSITPRTRMTSRLMTSTVEPGGDEVIDAQGHKARAHEELVGQGVKKGAQG